MFRLSSYLHTGILRDFHLYTSIYIIRAGLIICGWRILFGPGNHVVGRNRCRLSSDLLPNEAKQITCLNGPIQQLNFRGPAARNCSFPRHFSATPATFFGLPSSSCCCEWIVAIFQASLPDSWRRTRRRSAGRDKGRKKKSSEFVTPPPRVNNESVPRPRPKQKVQMSLKFISLH